MFGHPQNRLISGAATAGGLPNASNVNFVRAKRRLELNALKGCFPRMASDEAVSSR
jgi:hypothetical protein